MRILVTGASGYVGARLYADLSKDYEAFGTYHAQKLFPEHLQVDLSIKKQVFSLVKKTNPDIIVHVAANPSAVACNQDKSMAQKTNVISTENIVQAVDESNARIIYISSTAAISPYETYGQTKKEGENLVMQAKQPWLILRPSLILGQSPNTTNNRPHNRFLANIRDKTPPVYDNSWQFQPTWVGHLSQVIQSSIKKEVNGDIIPVIVPEKKTRFLVAKDILKSFGIKAIQSSTKDKSPSAFCTQKKLKEYKLPVYDYDTIIRKITHEIKGWVRENQQIKELDKQ